VSQPAAVVRVSDVFVTANPEYTYSSRDPEKLEDSVRDHLEERDKLLLLTGATKTGKTVLVDHVVPEVMGDNLVKLEGPMVSSADDMWQQIVDALGYYTDEGAEASKTESDTKSKGGSLGVNVPGVQASGNAGKGSTVQRTGATSRSVKRPVNMVGRDALLETGAALIIDDFHHIAPDVQGAIVKQLKSVVAQRKAPIILIAVPHHAADVVRSEPEMQGRLKHVQVPDWTETELKEIADLGYSVLNVSCPTELADRLAEVAWGSPHLMQVLCRELAKSNGIRQTQAEAPILQPPESWDEFLHDVAVENTDPKTLEILATGKQSRSRRIQRDLVGGGTADLYRALLAAIASTGPKRSLAYNEMRDALQGVLVKVPESNETTDILNKLSDLAADEAADAHGRTTDPVLEYDSDRVLHIVDPFFAFRLRWGPSVLTTQQ
jgi:hypothetical protein